LSWDEIPVIGVTLCPGRSFTQHNPGFGLPYSEEANANGAPNSRQPILSAIKVSGFLYIALKIAN